MKVRYLLGAAVLVACGSQEQMEQKEPAGSAAAAGSAGSAGSAAPPAPAAPSRGPERVAYSLVDNRLAAHLERDGGVLLPAGSAGFAKYVRFPATLRGEKSQWQLRQRSGDVPVARIAAKDHKAALYVPLTKEQAERSTVRIRARGAKAGALQLRANGGAAIEGALTGAWSAIDFAVPAGQLKEGENALELIAPGAGTEIAWIHAGAAKPSDTPDLAFYDTAQRALAIPRDGRMIWYVAVPEKGRLVADVGAGCAIRVRATPDTGTPVEGKLTGDGALELGALAGAAVRLELEATECARATLADAALAVPGTAPEAKRGAPPKHIVFIILDSLRVDRVHAFRPDARAETPVLDKLAESSTLFMNHYVQGMESQVSHAAMWTSMYLSKHRAPRFADKIPAKFTTIDEVAARAGLYTAAATANGYIRPSRGYGTQWKQYSNHIEKNLPLLGELIAEHGLSFVAPRKTAPWFLYLGLIDTHVVWRAKEPWLKKYSPDYSGRHAKKFGEQPGGGFPKNLTARDKEHIRAIYDSNISYQDEVIGKLIAKLEAWGVWDETMLVITADHGDELWEDGRVGHQYGQNETLVHVPLLIRYPPLFPAARIAHASEGIDLLPTFAEALGQPADPEWQGVSLVGVANSGDVYPGLASASEFELHHGGRVGRWKLVLDGLKAPTLYQITDDPYEKKDLFGAAGGLVGGRLVLDAMLLLRAQHAAWTKARWGNPANVGPEFAADAGE